VTSTDIGVLRVTLPSLSTSAFTLNDGTEESRSSKKEDIDGCLVKIKITWGKKDTSYLEEDYWFAAMYNTER